ncbi:histidine kinase [Tieghemostelium lacteum]|uniref:Histidine kinase n=1 Tax=Tieghemostelium lacteum TaxID=361077 RepID=A0A151ZHB3_TIELA|nr:histidine kinase [Tieghemostelium lacteum]|eukprot:KYQ93356.1 histidine kinase [Tieghemostelium lacteum]
MLSTINSNFPTHKQFLKPDNLNNSSCSSNNLENMNNNINISTLLIQNPKSLYSQVLNESLCNQNNINGVVKCDSFDFDFISNFYRKGTFPLVIVDISGVNGGFEFICNLKSILNPNEFLVLIYDPEQYQEISKLCNFGIFDFICPPSTPSFLLDHKFKRLQELVFEKQQLKKFKLLLESTSSFLNCFERSADFIEIWDRQNVSSRIGLFYSKNISSVEIVNSLWLAVNKKEVWKGVITIENGNGLLYYDSIVTPIMDQTGSYIQNFICIKRDITDKIQRKATKSLERIQYDKNIKLQISMLSHDIKTPLIGIMGMNNLLQGTQLNRQQSVYSDIIQVSCKSLLGMINDSLEVGKFQSVDISQREFDFRNTIYDVIEMMADSAQTKGINLLTNISPYIGTKFFGDEGKLKQILTNLIGNAIKFTKTGEIIVKCSLLDEPMIPIHGDIAKLKIQVEDTGCGIHPEAIPFLFKAFDEPEGGVVRHAGGYGLGLAICQQLIKKIFNGSITVQSTPGQGSCFNVIINLKVSSSSLWKEAVVPIDNKYFFEPSFGHPTDESMEPPNKSETNFQGLKVLQIDRSLNGRQFLQDQVSQWGITIDGVESIAQAKQLGKKLLKSFKIVLLDWDSIDEEVFSFITDCQNFVCGWILIIPFQIKNPQFLNRIWTSAGNFKIITKPVRLSKLSSCVQEITKESPDEPKLESIIPIENQHSNVYNYNILVVDDNVVSNLITTKLVQSTMSNVVSVHNSLEAIKVLKDSKIKFDIILMDLVMPVMDGYQLSKIIKVDKLSNAIIIATTSTLQNDDKIKLKSHFMDGYILKPLLLSDVKNLYKFKQNYRIN